MVVRNAEQKKGQRNTSGQQIRNIKPFFLKFMNILLINYYTPKVTVGILIHINSLVKQLVEDMWVYFDNILSKVTWRPLPKSGVSISFSLICIFTTVNAAP